MYLSLYFKQHREEYYRLLDVVRTHGNWEAWIDFFLEGVTETAPGAVDSAQRLLALFADDAKHIKTAGGRATPSLQIILGLLQSLPVATIISLATGSGLTFPTVDRAIQTLTNLGITSELTSKARGRVFAYKRYLAILSEGGEPLLG